MGYRSNYFDKNDAPKDLFGATKREVKNYAGYYTYILVPKEKVIIIIKTFL